MVELTNREWGTVIFTALVIAGLLLWPSTRRAVLSSIPSVFSSLINPHLLIPIILYVLYLVGVVLLTMRMGVWSIEMLKDTVIIGVFVGFPMLFKIPRIKGEFEFLRDVALDPLRVSALLVFYLNLSPLPIWGEVLVQAVLGFLVVLRTVGARDPSARAAVRLFDVVIVGIGIWLVIGTTVRLVAEAGTFGWLEALQSFALSIWLPLALVPFVYVLALYAAYEQVLKMLPFFNDQAPVRLRTVAALLVGTRLRTAYVSRVVGKWRGELATAPTFRAGYDVMSRFRSDYHAMRRQSRVDQARLKDNAGAQGVDADGLQLDRREFVATKKALMTLFFFEIGQHRNRLGRYPGNMVEFMSGSNLEGLPSDHGINEIVQADHQAWRAWRATPSGYVFGVGGTADVDAQWQYDGPTPPIGFPSQRAGWRNTLRVDGSPEWLAHEPMERRPA